MTQHGTHLNQTAVFDPMSRTVSFEDTSTREAGDD